MKSSRQLCFELVRELAAFSLEAATIILLYQDNLLLLATVSVETLLAVGLWHERRDVAAFLGLALIGSAAEAVFVHFGVWRYANPSLLGFPPWFPVAFGLAGLIGQRLVGTVTEMWTTAPTWRADRE